MRKVNRAREQAKDRMSTSISSAGFAGTPAASQSPSNRGRRAPLVASDVTHLHREKSMVSRLEVVLDLPK